MAVPAYLRPCQPGQAGTLSRNDGPEQFADEVGPAAETLAGARYHRGAAQQSLRPPAGLNRWHRLALAAGAISGVVTSERACSSSGSTQGRPFELEPPNATTAPWPRRAHPPTTSSCRSSAPGTPSPDTGRC